MDTSLGNMPYAFYLNDYPSARSSVFNCSALYILLHLNKLSSVAVKRGWQSMQASQFMTNSHFYTIFLQSNLPENGDGQ